MCSVFGNFHKKWTTIAITANNAVMQVGGMLILISAVLTGIFIAAAIFDPDGLTHFYPKGGVWAFGVLTTCFFIAGSYFFTIAFHYRKQ